MRNLLAFVAALVLTVAGVGLYLDWFKVRTGSSGAGRTVNIDINTEKIGDDLREGGEYLLEQGGEKIHEIIEKRRKEPGGPAADDSKSGAAPETIPGPFRPALKDEEPRRGTSLARPPEIEY